MARTVVEAPAGRTAEGRAEHANGTLFAPWAPPRGGRADIGGRFAAPGDVGHNAAPRRGRARRAFPREPQDTDQES